MINSFIFVMAVLVGTSLGWGLCYISYVRYRKTADALRVLDDFKVSLIEKPK